MPTQRFLNLSEEKKESIRHAAIEEFTRVPTEAVSINKIIKEAGISRGSFYTYFEDKRDLMRYLMTDIRRRQWELTKISLKKSNGDFFKASDLLLELCIKYFVDQDIFKFAKTMMKRGEVFPALETENVDLEKEKSELSEWIWNNTDKTKLGISGINEFKDLVALVQTVITMSVFRYCVNKEKGEDQTEVYNSYENIMKFIKRGAVFCNK